MFRLIGLLFFLLSIASGAHAFESSEEVVAKLSKWDISDIEADVQRVEKGQNLLIDEMFDDLEHATAFFSNRQVDAASALQMQRVALLTFLHDPMTFGAELIAPAYAKNKVTFKKASKQLHPYDRKLVEEQLERYARCLKYKNGCPQD